MRSQTQHVAAGKLKFASTPPPYRHRKIIIALLHKAMQ